MPILGHIVVHSDLYIKIRGEKKKKKEKKKKINEKEDGKEANIGTLKGGPKLRIYIRIHKWQYLKWSFEREI